MIPADLLDQLREKDLELWEKWIYRISVLEEIEFTSPTDPLSLAWLQYCLQEAIRARGWFYQIVTKGEWFLGKHISDLGVEAYVGPDPGCDLDTGYADTEAEALMRAYLSALSGERI